mmetsp:Transcript_31962/g.77266  ORF Transcript_31962/g.77266 Transcript_31962/m.77266 type:complete len:90 (-) Transcript_31962:1691-1960(-)
MRMPPKMELMPINKDPKPCAVCESRKTDIIPWPKKVNTPKEKVMNSQYEKNLAALTAKPTVKYQRRQNTIDASKMKGTSTRVNARAMAL